MYLRVGISTLAVQCLQDVDKWVMLSLSENISMSAAGKKKVTEPQ